MHSGSRFGGHAHNGGLTYLVRMHKAESLAAPLSDAFAGLGGNRVLAA